jgi:excisionase family DNA binding protein
VKQLDAQSSEPTLLTVDEVAQVVRCHPTTVRRAVAAGDLRAGHLGHGPKAQMRIAPADVSRWLAANDRGSR